MRPMYRRILIILCSIAVLFIIDRGFGLFLDYARTHAREGYTARTEYINNKSRDSVYVFGSSRALHHYDTPYMTERLGVPVYNAGRDGTGIILAYMELLNIINRGHRPSLIIYDVYVNYDVNNYDMPDETTFAEQRPYFDNKGIAEVYGDVMPAERYKMVSRVYRYNTKWLQVLNDWIRSKKIDDRGYIPIDGTLAPEAINYIEPYALGEVWDKRIKYFERFINLCRDNDIPIVFIVSPVYQKTDFERDHKDILPVLKKYGYELHDYLNHEDFVGNPDYFFDPGHLNTVGARRFTELILNEVIK